MFGKIVRRSEAKVGVGIDLLKRDGMMITITKQRE